MSKVLVVIPARWGSTRLPGKPLALIAGKTMLQRVIEVATAGSRNFPEVSVVVATDDDRIMAHAQDLGVQAVMTPASCPTGTDRALAALHALDGDFASILNLQGDTPLTPPALIASMLQTFREDPSHQVITPVVQLSWNELDTLREQKQKTPLSGTTVIRLEDGRAAWFSKNIVPAIRKEAELRKTETLSPVFRHIGIYGYRRDILERYVTLSQSYYENIEGLEQLRALENGITIQTVPVHLSGRPSMSGVDSPEDIKRAEALIAQYGEVL
jgi:3-deoxy-manno-octulosonate cytidylyltransferase (CMP-KDO synthetase)